MEEVFFGQRVLAYEFDKVLDVQRKSFYRQRNRVLLDEDLKEETMNLISKEVYRRIVAPIKTNKKNVSKDDIEKVVDGMKKMTLNGWFRPHKFLQEGIEMKDLRSGAYKSISAYYNDFEKYVSAKRMRSIEKWLS